MLDLQSANFKTWPQVKRKIPIYCMQITHLQRSTEVHAYITVIQRPLFSAELKSQAARQHWWGGLTWRGALNVNCFTSSCLFQGSFTPLLYAYQRLPPQSLLGWWRSAVILYQEMEKKMCHLQPFRVS